MNMSSKEIVTILNRLGVPVANHMSVMDNEMVQKVEQFFEDVKRRAAERRAQEMEKELRERQQKAKAEAQAEQTQGRASATPASGGRDRQAQGQRDVEHASASHQGHPPRRERDGGRDRGGAQGRGRDRREGAPNGSGEQRPDQRPRSDRPGDRPGGQRGPNGGHGRNGAPGQGDRHRDHRGGYAGRPQGQQGHGDRPNGRGRDGQRSTPGNGGGARFPRAPRPPQAVAAQAAQQKPVAPGSQRKEKERKDRDGYQRHEEFNETKLQRAPKRRAGRQEKPLPTEATVEGPMTVGEFAKLLQREPAEIIKRLLMLGVMATINQDIDTDTMELIGSDLGVTVHVKEPVDEEALELLVEPDDPSELVSRPPVVTIMGHVDHGKTTLLDALRESRVAAGEAGGITQHIGAYQVEVGGRLITFLDTPGHEAFTTMRARGAQVTDVTILVVAADDGVMPQTVEAVNHAKAANVPIIVAINKIDKPDANPDRVKQELVQYGLVPEAWGGDTVFVEISALKRLNLDTLLEMVLLVADMQDLKANPNARPRGTVIEAKLDRGRGPVATVLVQNGTLKVGDIVIAGTTYGRVRAMVNESGRRLKAAPPSTPVEIQGLNGVPQAGDLFVVYDDEKSARSVVEKRLERERQQMQATARVTLDDLYRQIKEGNVAELNVIVKADVQGSVEALVQSIEKINVEGVRVRVIHKGVGAITESDVQLASASNAIIIGFHVRPDANARRVAEQQKIDIRLYRVIYDAIAEIESAMKGMLAPEYKEVIVGHAEVRETFNISKVGTVAGCYVTDGRVPRDADVRVVRDGIVIYEGKLSSLRRFKDDVREVASGYECGLTIEKFNDIKVGDVIEAFTMEQVARV
ncbi:translation initiation factor IF-2 [Alicyclobacillus mali (ex Roth et al. 2021)]|uniref:translation initiation factor IF-2 n=1 Tax=Alicyclobacillus mali (ex Roth et al. 2021) TaxID=1123961 RepID=UPI00241411DB|nr:translation initiation factor IF-2 [Alicyclobacillus mali (ex Roth et al. 2021)]